MLIRAGLLFASVRDPLLVHSTFWYDGKKQKRCHNVATPPFLPKLLLIHLWTTVDNGTFNLLNQVGNGDIAWARIRTIKDSTAAPDPITSPKNLQTLGGTLITTIEDEAVRIDN